MSIEEAEKAILEIDRQYNLPELVRRSKSDACAPAEAERLEQALQALHAVNGTHRVPPVKIEPTWHFTAPDSPTAQWMSEQGL